jgi:hypothetical protein
VRGCTSSMEVPSRNVTGMTVLPPSRRVGGTNGRVPLRACSGGSVSLVVDVGAMVDLVVVLDGLTVRIREGARIGLWQCSLRRETRGADASRDLRCRDGSR